MAWSTAAFQGCVFKWPTQRGTQEGVLGRTRKKVYTDAGTQRAESTLTSSSCITRTGSHVSSARRSWQGEASLHHALITCAITLTFRLIAHRSRTSCRNLFKRTKQVHTQNGPFSSPFSSPYCALSRTNPSLEGCDARPRSVDAI